MLKVHDLSKEIAHLEETARMLSQSGCTIAVGESLTGGLLANSFARMNGASDFFAGGIVAYTPEVKFRLLGVTRGPVVTQKAADEMAIGVQKLFRSHLALAATGVGGPGPDEGTPAGTVFIVLRIRDSTNGEYRKELHIDGDPQQVCLATCEECLLLVQKALKHIS